MSHPCFIGFKNGNIKFINSIRIEKLLIYFEFTPIFFLTSTSETKPQSEVAGKMYQMADNGLHDNLVIQKACLLYVNEGQSCSNLIFTL